MRRQYRDSIAWMSQEEKKDQSQSLVERLAVFLKSQREGFWTLFDPLMDEPDLMGLTHLCPHISWVFPIVLSPTHMVFSKGFSSSERGQDHLNPKSIAGFIIPALALDDLGTRLGRGGGHYDRFLEKSAGLRVGVVFDQGMSPVPLPRKSWDQPMDVVVTPSDWFWVGGLKSPSGKRVG